MLNYFNLILLLVVLVLLIVVIKSIYSIEKPHNRKKSHTTQQFNTKIVNSIEVTNGKDKLDINSIVSGNLLGILISSSCSACMPNFENFLNISSKLLSPNDYYVFLHEDDTKAKEYLSLIHPDFQILFYKDNFIKELGIEFIPAFFMLDKEGILKISTPIEQQFLFKLTNLGLIPA